MREAREAWSMFVFDWRVEKERERERVEKERERGNRTSN